MLHALVLKHQFDTLLLLLDIDIPGIETMSSEWGEKCYSVYAKQLDLLRISMQNFLTVISGMLQHIAYRHVRGYRGNMCCCNTSYAGRRSILNLISELQPPAKTPACDGAASAAEDTTEQRHIDACKLLYDRIQVDTECMRIWRRESRQRAKRD